MNCLDTIGVICSYLTKKDLIEVGNVSCLCRRASLGLMPEELRRYFAGACYKEDAVDLAPPGQVIGLCYREAEGRLLVLSRGDSPLSGDEECFLYIQNVESRNDFRSYQRLELPNEFARPSSHVCFEGQRFLCCTTREGTISVFDCLLQAPLELPFGVDGFHASACGQRCVVDYDRYLYYCSCATSVVVWENERGKKPQPSATTTTDVVLSSSNSLMGSSPSSPLTTWAMPRAQMRIDDALLQYPLGDSSSAWRMFWVGKHSVLYVHEDGVVMLKETPAGGSFEAIDLFALAAHSSSLAHGSCSSVFSWPCGRDDYLILDCRNRSLCVITASPLLCDPSITWIKLQSLIPPMAVIKDVCVAHPGSALMVFMQHQQQDRVLFFTLDLSLTRWITIGPPSTVTLLAPGGVLISAPLHPEDSPSHPLLDTVEGGVGTVFSFGDKLPFFLHSEAVCIDIKLDAYEEYEGWITRVFEWMMPQSFNGVETLSWMALAVVSASLVWTVSALVYNGWWLHLQLLLWGKLPSQTATQDKLYQDLERMMS